jgi:hypothetical protein
MLAVRKRAPLAELTRHSAPVGPETARLERATAAAGHGHAKHDPAPPVAYVPAGHCEQAAAAPLENVPAAQLLHEEEPAEPTNCPAGHAEQPPARAPEK